MTALLLAVMLSQAPDAGTDVPLQWHLEKAGTTLQQDAAVTTPENAQAFDIGLRTCQGDRDGCMGEVKAGTAGVTVKWALAAGGTGIALGIALVVGVLAGTGHLK